MTELLRDVPPGDSVLGDGVTEPGHRPIGGAQPWVERGRGPGRPLRHHAGDRLLHRVLQPGRIDNGEVNEDSDILTEKNDDKDEKLNLDFKLLECDIVTKAEKEAPSPIPAGSLFLFGSMFKNQEDDDEEEEDNKELKSINVSVDDNETVNDNEVVEEVAVTGISIEVIEAAEDKESKEENK